MLRKGDLFLDFFFCFHLQFWGFLLFLLYLQVLDLVSWENIIPWILYFLCIGALSIFWLSMYIFHFKETRMKISKFYLIQYLFLFYAKGSIALVEAITTFLPSLPMNSVRTTITYNDFISYIISEYEFLHQRWWICVSYRIYNKP